MTVVCSGFGVLLLRAVRGRTNRIWHIFGEISNFIHFNRKSVSFVRSSPLFKTDFSPQHYQNNAFYAILFKALSELRAVDWDICGSFAMTWVFVKVSA